jgi:hypothetical protein
MKDILHKILFWRKWKRKLEGSLTDEYLSDLEKDIDEQLHIHEPAGKVYKHKNNKYNHKTMKKKGGKKC